jgi:regulator of RNase E activity RraB
VDHFAYFGAAQDRKNFISRVRKSGFEVAELGYDSNEDLGYSVQFFRSESVELDEIHDAVMGLVQTAEEFEGLYDGWETSVVSSAPKRDALPN